MRGCAPLLTLTVLGVLLLALPDLFARRQSAPLPVRKAAESIPVPDPQQRPLALLANGLLPRLEQADRSWIPRAEQLPQGGTRYLYKRRPGEPELSVAEIRERIARPPSHATERQAIVELLTTLERVGAGIALLPPIRVGAAAEWDPQARLLRLRPDLPDQGSIELARVLNHEAIHVAQSCAGGGVGANPRPLGSLGVADSQAAQQAAAALEDPVYADLDASERRMEQEAYALQNRLDLGVRLLRRHCLQGRSG